MLLIALVCASDRCGNNIKPASSRKVFGRFRKVFNAKKFLDLAPTAVPPSFKRCFVDFGPYMLSFLDDLV